MLSVVTRAALLFPGVFCQKQFPSCMFVSLNWCFMFDEQILFRKMQEGDRIAFNFISCCVSGTGVSVR